MWEAFQINKIVNFVVVKTVKRVTQAIKGLRQKCKTNSSRMIGVYGIARIDRKMFLLHFDT